MCRRGRATRAVFSVGSVVLGIALTVAGCGSGTGGSAALASDSESVAAPTSRPSRVLGGEDEVGTVRVDEAGEQERRYLLHVPLRAVGSRAPIPVVLALHGTGGTPEEMAEVTGFNKLADLNRFLVVYPEGVDGSWADGRGVSVADQTDVDDVRFIEDLLDLLELRYTIDPARVYVAGYSGGGLFAQRLACELADRLAAVASVAATLPETVRDVCEPSRPLSILMIHGTADPLVPFEGGEARGALAGPDELLAAGESAEFWMRAVDCVTTPAGMDLPDTAHDGTRHRVLTWSRCAAGSEVSLHTVEHGGHTWPGGSAGGITEAMGVLSTQFAATEVIWAFFFAHPSGS